MKKFIIGAAIQSFVFSLCVTGLTALISLFMNDRMNNDEILLTLLLTFIGWFVWTIIDTYILDKKKQ